MRFFVVIFLFCIAGGPARSQIDSILALEGENARVKGFIDWANHQITLNQRERTVPLLEQARERFKRMGQKKLYREAWYCLERWKASEGGGEKWYEQSISRLIQSAEVAGRKGWWYTEAECRMDAARLLFDFTKKFPQAFEQMITAYDLIQKAGLNDYPEANRLIDAMATRYYQFGDYSNAIRYFKESMNAPAPWASTGYLHETQNTIGLCFQALKQYDSAVYYFQQAHDRALELKNQFWAALTDGNKGYTYYLMGDYDRAFPLMEADFRASVEAGETGSAMNAALGLAAISLYRGNTAAAEQYIAYARQYINRDYINQNVSYYRSLYLISKLRGNFRDAVLYGDSFLYFRDSQSKISDSRIISQARLKVEVDQHVNELKLLESSRSRQVLIRNGLLIGLVLVGVIAALLVNRHLIRKRKEFELTALEKKHALEALERSRQELHAFTSALKEKNDLIESFRLEIDKLRQTDIGSERIEQLNQLVNASLLTEEDWKQFRLLFDKVYPGFFIRLKEKMPDLGSADTRLMALTKLQLSQKEMAAMLGVGYDAIRKARQRLRQKINLPGEGSLDEVADLI